MSNPIIPITLSNKLTLNPTPISGSRYKLYLLVLAQLNILYKYGYIKTDGSVWGWGYNAYGQLGDNSIVSKLTPVAVQGATKTFCKISGSGNHSLAIDKNGKVWGWGFNSYGQLGDNSVTNRSTPVAVLGAAKTFCQISGGSYHSLALDKNGRAWGWGYNAYGILGNNSIVSQRTPVAILGATKTFCKISGGQSHSLAIDKNGKAWSWGYNYYGILGNNSVTNQSTPIAVYGNHTFCQIVCGQYHSLAIDKNGKAWSWGSINNLGLNMGNIIPTLGFYSHTFNILNCRYRTLFGLKNDGILWAMADGRYGMLGNNTAIAKNFSPLMVCGSHNFCCIAGSNGHSLAIDNNGKAWSWGFNLRGQLGNNSMTSRLTPVAVLGTTKTFCQISGGDAFSLALDKNGKAWSWGFNGSGQLGDNSITSRLIPVAVLGTTKTFCQISTCPYAMFSIGLDKNRKVWSWGTNAYGQLGNNSITSRRTPVAVLGATKTFCKIVAGSNNCAALDKNGKAWCWGYNNLGQLGDNSLTNRSTPVAVYGNHTFCFISIGGVHALAIDNNGKTWSWGNNGSGQLGDSTTINKCTPILVLGNHTFCQVDASNYSTSTALDNNGKMWGWGNNYSGQLGRYDYIKTPMAVYI